MSDIWDYSGTASSNTAADGININTGMTPANVDDALRAILAIMRNSLHVDLKPFMKATAPLPVANGGTGATTIVAALAALGALEAGYRDLQLVSKSAAFTFADGERGKRINYTGAAAAATIDPNSTTATTDGAVYVIRNNGSGVLTITRGAGVTLKVNGSTSSANAALAVGGVASLIRWGVDDWSITGSGLS